MFIYNEHLLLEVLVPHAVLFVEEVDIPEAVFLRSCQEVHLEQHLFVKKRV